MNIRLRAYKDDDFETVAALFYKTVHTVCAADYTQKQLSAWTNGAQSLNAKRKDLREQYTLVAECGNDIVGFGSIDKYGCLDMLFVRYDRLRQGIATALCDALERDFADVTTYASITAKPFFEHRGYTVKKAQTVLRAGVRLTNYEMQKKRNFTR